MPRLIIYLSGRPLTKGYKQGPFVWSETHQCYLYQGKEFQLHEFNGVATKALRDYADFGPSVRVVGLDEKPAQKPTAVQKVTVDEAEAVLRELAPEMLKKKTGRKPTALVA
jgi:hypothetical protein